MSEEKKRIVNIKRGSMKISVERKDLISVNQTFDGVIFNFANSMQLILTDSFMRLQTKNLLESVSKIPNGNINIDLDNYRNPTSVDI